MVAKLELLRYYAQKHGVDVELVNEIFEIERARLHSGEYEEKHRQEDILETIAKWIRKNSRG